MPDAMPLPDADIAARAMPLILLDAAFA